VHCYNHFNEYDFQDSLLFFQSFTQRKNAQIGVWHFVTETPVFMKLGKIFLNFFMHKLIEKLLFNSKKIKLAFVQPPLLGIDQKAIFRKPFLYFFI
jgi:hypothetical protein